MSINRRQFMRRAAGAVSTAALMGTAGSQRLAGQEQTLPAPDASGIGHIVVVMMGNRSFDHLLGWLPGGNGTQAGLSYVDKRGAAHPTFRLSTFLRCSHPGHDHSYAGGRSEYDHRKMDGSLQPSSNVPSSIGYAE